MLQINHIMSVTGHPTSARLQQALDESATGRVACGAVCGIFFGCVFGIVPLALVYTVFVPLRVGYTGSGSVWGCATMWLLLLPIIIGCPLSILRRARSASNALP
jgi:hypothetical protein